MKQSWQNRLLAMFLTVVMVIGLCPTYAFADDETDVQEAVVEEASVAAPLAEETETEDSALTTISSIVKDMQTVLDICGITPASTDKEMLDAIYSTQDETVPELIEEIWWACEGVSESEAATSLKNRSQRWKPTPV